MKSTIKLKDDEIIIDCYINKDIIISMFITGITIVGLLAIVYISALYFFLFPLHFLSVSVIYLLITRLEWKKRGYRTIVVDKKYIIIFENIGCFFAEKVYKMKDIESISIDNSYQISIWTRIKSFWTKDADGCIQFGYKGRNIRLASGLTVSQANEFISLLREKHYIYEGKIKTDERKNTYVSYLIYITLFLLVLLGLGIYLYTVFNK
jgi:hypothetical protein